MPVARRIDSTTYVKRTKTLGILLYLFLIPPLISVVLALFSLQIGAFFLNLIAFLLFLAALYFSKKGFAAQWEYESVHFAKAPKPYKLTGAIFLSLATFYSAFVLSRMGLFQSLFLALIAFVGYYLWYGFDPMKDKIPDTGDMGSEVAYKTLQEAREKLKKSQELVKDIRNYDLRKRVERTLKKAEEILQELDKKPAYVRRLRKFLVVFVDSVYDVTQSYVKTQEEISEEMKSSLFHLMDEVERRFDRELEKVRSQGANELDTKMRTLDKQIKEE
ncbi:MAG: hypothetical protein GXO19_04995 [Epsilonproteobacteria bacterium]|nr:hypothetical protein [Campylobacterota bacterium]NPA57074.1 hypothetical protein [Campylobacterota bacterium]